MDMSAFVIPKSDQLNADDLLSGPRTIKITKVSGTGNADQPVAVHFDGDDKKPYKPCKSMRRVMIAAWGVDAAQYVGRLMTLYCDPAVMFGGMRVGGIRISHMSHIDHQLNLALTVTKAKRARYTVAVLKDALLPTPDPHAAVTATLRTPAGEVLPFVRGCLNTFENAWKSELARIDLEPEAVLVALAPALSDARGLFAKTPAALAKLDALEQHAKALADHVGSEFDLPSSGEELT